MTKKTKVIISAVVSVVAVAIICVAVVLVVTSGPTVPHLQAEGVNLTLTREKLTYNALQQNGILIPQTDSQHKDFSKPSKENVFGISQSTMVIPGSMYSAEMTVASNDNVAFCYWLEVKFLAGSDAICNALVLTVTADDGTVTKLRLKDGFLVGDEQNPIAFVEGGKSSTFKVKMELSDNFADNAAQGTQVSFDLVVHAAKSNKG